MQPLVRSLFGAAFLLSLLIASAAPAQEKTVKGLKYEVYKDAKEEFRWRLKSANGNTIATAGQGYTSKENCVSGIELLQKEAGKKNSSLSFEVYEDAKMEFRWRCKSSNGKTVATSSQGYSAKTDCERGVEIVKGSSAAKIVDAKAK